MNDIMDAATDIPGKLPMRIKNSDSDTRCVQHNFEMQVTETPDAAALTDGEHHLSYSELNAQANQLAHHLMAMGAGPNTLVGLCTRRSINTVIGVLGILKAGAAYVPIDPSLPRERIKNILQDISTTKRQAPLLLTQHALHEHLEFYQGTCICLDSDQKAIAGNADNNPPLISKPEHTAYVIYTSGPTGKPKGSAYLTGACIITPSGRLSLSPGIKPA